MDLGELIKKGEVAWLSAEEMMRASEPAQTGAYWFPSDLRHAPTMLPHTDSCKQGRESRLVMTPLNRSHIANDQ